MKIAIIGSGGREHALAATISKSSTINEIFCIPGNAGTSKIATNIELDIDEFDKVHKFVNDNSIDLVVVGPEQPLVNGIVDYLEKFDIKVFGPNKIASQLEGSKIFTKKLYEQSTNLFNWYQQLVAESLGKDKKGILPIISVMPKDNHSVMQLYLDGFKNNFFTFFYSHENNSIKINN